MFKNLITIFLFFTLSVTIHAQTLYDIISASPDHTILKAAIDAAGLESVLDDESLELTVFAPNDDAFDALPEGTVDALLEDPEGALLQILLYHAVEGVVESGDLFDGQIVPTIQGQDVAITVNPDGVYVNDSEVIAADIVATNGILHVIDAVLLPDLSGQSIYEIIAADLNFQILTAALNASGLDELLNSPDVNLTLFAPTDEAFEALPPGTIEALLEDPQGLLSEILAYHVLPEVVESGDLFDEMILTTALGQDITVTINEDGVFINEAKVIIVDILASNGIIHVIDAVLLPDLSGQTIYEIISTDPDFEILTAALNASGLDELLNREGVSLTLFAPTDEAFEALPPGTIEALLEDPQGLLSEILAYHVLPEIVESGDLFDEMILTTALGQDVTVTINGDGIFINDAKVIIADIQATNGIIHVIDAVLVPSFGGNTIYDIVSNSVDHTILTQAIQLAGFQGALSSDEVTLTLFAPTDQAFQNLPPQLLEALLDDPDGLLAKALRYHVLGDAALSTELFDGQSITTLLGQDIEITIDSNGVFVNDAQVIVADIIASNGVVHVLDAVLIPLLTVYDVISNSEVHSTLETAILEAGLDEALQGTGPFTIFAPTDAAFAALPPGLLEALLADPQGDLTDVLLYHVVGGEYLSIDLIFEDMLTTLLGQDIEVLFDQDGILINNARVTIADIETFNGVVHVIDAVLVPEFNSIRNLEQVNIRVLPNPTASVINIEIPESWVGNEIQGLLVSMTGTVIKSWTISNAFETVDLSSYPSGMYIFTLNTNKEYGRTLIVRE
jgi:transforming growth factor-beta-induced protein